MITSQIKETTAGPALERAEGPPQLVSDRPRRGSSNSFRQIGVDENVDAPVIQEKHIITDIQDSFKGTDVPKQRRRRRKLFPKFCFGCTWDVLKLNIHICYSGAAASKAFSKFLVDILEASPCYKVFIDWHVDSGEDLRIRPMKNLENIDLAIVVVTRETFLDKRYMLEMDLIMNLEKV